MRVCSKLSGDLLATMEDEIARIIGADLKKLVARIVNINRFRLLLFWTDNVPVDNRSPLPDLCESLVRGCTAVLSTLNLLEHL